MRNRLKTKKKQHNLKLLLFSFFNPYPLILSKWFFITLRTYRSTGHKSTTPTKKITFGLINNYANTSSEDF